MKTYKDWNLDDPNEVEEFIAEFGTNKNRWLARALGITGNGAHKIANLLSGYAWNKHAAMVLRQRGDIATAIQYEIICDSIYRRMPKDVRW